MNWLAHHEQTLRGAAQCAGALLHPGQKRSITDRTNEEAATIARTSKPAPHVSFRTSSSRQVVLDFGFITSRSLSITASAALDGCPDEIRFMPSFPGQ